MNVTIIAGAAIVVVVIFSAFITAIRWRELEFFYQGAGCNRYHRALFTQCNRGDRQSCEVLKVSDCFGRPRSFRVLLFFLGIPIAGGLLTAYGITHRLKRRVPRGGNVVPPLA